MLVYFSTNGVVALAHIALPHKRNTHFALSLLGVGGLRDLCASLPWRVRP